MPLPSKIDFKWGKHTFTYKKRYLAISKQEFINLLENSLILNQQGKPFEKIGDLQFQFRNQPTSKCSINGSLEEMRNTSCLTQNLSILQNGDLINFNNLYSPIQTAWLTVVIQENKNPSKETIIQKSLQKEEGYLKEFTANGKYLIKQGVPFETLLQELTQSRHGRLKVEGENMPRLDVFFHSKETNLIKEEIYEHILEELKKKYSLTIKAKYQEQTGWFLSEGDPDKLNQLTEEKVKPNLEYFNEQVRAKGQEPLGPFNYNWFADRYLPMEYGIQVTDLTEFSGRYILPLKTKDLKSLQKQLKKDYGLILKQQTRTIPITVVRFEQEDQ